MTADSFKSSSGQNQRGLRQSDRARNSNQVCLPLLTFALRELYHRAADDYDLSLHSAAGFSYLFKFCTD